MDKINIILQTEEVEALRSIYGHDWAVECDASKTYSIQVRVASLMVILSITMPPTYPTRSPPRYQLSAPWMDRSAKAKLHQLMDAVSSNNSGQPTVFNWVEKIRSVLQSMLSLKSGKQGKQSVIIPSLPDSGCRCPPITHGEVVTDRKSSFQGHAAQVTSVEEVHAVLASLKTNKKILNAKHNMYAYRIERPDGRIVQDCDDDGEAHASGRMLNLLVKMDQRKTVVIVTRWFGGIQLGPDRFRHITNATRQAIEVAGLRPSNGKSNKKKK